MKKVHKELVKSFTSYRIALKYGRVKPKLQPQSNDNTTSTGTKEEVDEKKISLQQRMRDVQNSNDFVGCMPSGFTFNEPEGYKKVRNNRLYC